MRSDGARIRQNHDRAKERMEVEMREVGGERERGGGGEEGGRVGERELRGRGDSI